MGKLVTNVFGSGHYMNVRNDEIISFFLPDSMTKVVKKKCVNKEKGEISRASFTYLFKKFSASDGMFFVNFLQEG